MKSLIFLASALLILGGCSATWSGIKQDTSDALQWTKEKVGGK